MARFRGDAEHSFVGMCSVHTLFYGRVEDLAEGRVNMPRAGSDCQLHSAENIPSSRIE